MNKLKIVVGSFILLGTISAMMLVSKKEDTAPSALVHDLPILWKHYSCVNKVDNSQQVADFKQSIVEFVKRENDRVYWRIYTPERPTIKLALVISIDPGRVTCGYLH